MNSLSSWIQPLLYFLVALGLASVVGLVFYMAGYRISWKYPQGVLIVGILLGIVTLFFILRAPNPILLVCVLAICGVGASAERAFHPSQQNWFSVWLRLWLTTVCCVVFSLFLMRAIGMIPSASLVGAGNSTWFDWGTAVGLFCSPPVLPIFGWFYKSGQLRPGMDAPLRDSQ